MLGLSKMRLCVIFALISVVISRPQGPEELREDHPEDTPSDMQMLDEEDMKQLLTDLFISSSRDARQLELDEDADDGEDGDAADVADVTDDADNTLEYEAAVDSDSKASEEEVARFNNYIDAIYRRMNAALRAKMMDPMTLNLDDKQKKKSNKPRSLGKREADDEDEDEEEFDEKDDTPEVLEEDVMEHRAGKAEKKGNGKGRKRSGAAARKNKKNKKGKKEDKEDKATKKAEREAAKKEKQEKKMKKQELREKKRAEKKKEKAGASRRQSRSGQKNKNKKKQSNNKNKKSRNTNNKNKKTKSTNNKNKRYNNNNKGRSGNARNNVKDEKMMGSLSGIATLRREGDVMVKEEETHKIITSEFNVGPLQLEVSKMYGKGQARTVKSAKAITEVMSGTMTLKVKPDGSAHVKKVVFKEPENVDVKGSLSDNKPRNLRYLKNSVNKMRPLAAIRVLKTARYVLKSPNSSATAPREG